MKMKKVAAIVLATTMAMGSSLTVFAAGTVSGGDPASGSTEGQGTNEGHVEKESINVVLPVMPTTGSPFDYITDPERLIQGTNGAAHADAKFPNNDSDTGVYFKVGANEYANTSKTLKVINKSSCNVTVTVAIEAEQNSANDLALATSAATSKDNPLYLAVNVGSTSHVLTSSSTSVKKVIAGNADNFEVTYTSDGGYAYTTKEDAINWKALEFNVTGAVDETAVVTADTTAPTVKVTWSYAKAVEADGSVSQADQVDYVDEPIVEFDYTGAIKISNLKEGQAVSSVVMAFGRESYEMTTNANTAWDSEKTEGQLNSVWLNALKGQTVTLTVTFSDGTKKIASTVFTDGVVASFDTTGLIKISNLKVGQAVTSVKMSFGKESYEMLTNANTTWNFAKTEGQLNNVWLEAVKGQAVTITITFSDGDSKTVTTQF